MKVFLKFSILISFSFFINLINAQQPTDCIDAVIACGNSEINLNVSGIGTQELSGSNTCSSQENNSVWLKVTLVTNGTLGFTLTPRSTAISEDYDFFVFGPDVPCNNLGVAIRCSTTNPQAAFLGNNLTGMNSTSTDTSEGPGGNGDSFVSNINARAGETYFIVIDRPIGNSAFSLEWTGTADFSEPPTNASAATGSSIDLESCDVIAPFDDGLTIFDLSENDAPIRGGQSDISISYHTTESNANIGTLPLISPYTNISNPQTLYVRITNNITGCFEITEFDLNVNIGPNFVSPNDYALCDDLIDGNDTNGQVIFDLQSRNNEILNGQNPFDLNITYHLNQLDAEANISALPNLYYNTTPFIQQVFVRIEDIINPDCNSITTLNLLVNPNPIAFNDTLIQCDEDGTVDGLTLFNLNEANTVLTGGISDLSTEFYTDLGRTNRINGNAFSNTINPQTIYVTVVNETTGCIDFSELVLDVSVTNTGDTQLFVCDDDGTEDGYHLFDLSLADTNITNGLPAGLNISYFETYNDALLEQNDLGTSFTNTVAYSQTIFARVENANNCYGISEVVLTVNELPNIETYFETLYCLNTFPQTITLTSGLINNPPSDFTYLWSTGETTQSIQINDIGTYTVTVTNANNCTKERTITVVASNIATFENIEVVDASSNNTLTIIVSGEGIYEFALNDINGPYQTSNFFDNVAPGLHTIYVRDIKNDCGIVDKLVSVIGFPKFFTPNADSYNDTWQVSGISSQFQPNSKILIFDRYGKLLKQLNPLGEGWDGTFNGSQLPSSDYWFQVTLQDGRTYKSHFTLKR